MKTPHSERAHAILAPSASKRWIECPASAYWSAILPPQEETVYSKWGTECHEFGEAALRLALNGKSPQSVYDKIREKKMRDLVQDWVDFCCQLYTRIKAVADSAPHFYIEERVKFSEDIYGTLDFGVIFKKGGKHFVVGADLKSGAGVKVEVKRSTQLMIYLEGFCRTLNIKPEAVYIYIFQPQVFDEPQKDKLTADEFSEEITKIESAERRALKVMSSKPMLEDYSPGDWCKFCPALAECPAVRSQSKALITKALSEEAPGLIPLSEMISIFEQKSRIEDWLSEIEHHLITRLSKGGKVKGYKLVRGRSNRSWIDDEEKVASSLKKLGITNPYHKELITIGDAERTLKEKVPEKLTKKGEGKLQIVLESDPRDAVKSNSLNLIDEVDNERRQSKTNRTRNFNKKLRGKPEARNKKSLEKKVRGRDSKRPSSKTGR